MTAKGMSAEGENSRSKVEGAARQPGPQGLPKTNPTPEELALAERIAWDQWPNSLDYPERDAARSAALSAIQQTTELAAIAMEVFLDDPLLSGHGYATGAANALRRNDHLGDV